MRRLGVTRLGVRRVGAALPVALALLAANWADSRAEQARPRGVVELFTSQGCSSCPSADKLASELARDPSLVVISLPIDYWDYLGWKDTLAKPRHTARQRGYANARGDREVYTPQVVVNGEMHVLGSDKAAIERVLAETREQNKAILSVPVDVAVAKDKLTITLPSQPDSNAKAEVWLCPFSGSVPVKIERGENRGHTLTYANVVRRWVKLGDWSGAARTFTVPAAEVEGADGVAILVQDGTVEHPGAMLGAAVASLH